MKGTTIKKDLFKVHLRLYLGKIIRPAGQQQGQGNIICIINGLSGGFFELRGGLERKRGSFRAAIIESLRDSAAISLAGRRGGRRWRMGRPWVVRGWRMRRPGGNGIYGWVVRVVVVGEVGGGVEGVWELGMGLLLRGRGRGVGGGGVRVAVHGGGGRRRVGGAMADGG